MQANEPFQFDPGTLLHTFFDENRQASGPPLYDIQAIFHLCYLGSIRSSNDRNQTLCKNDQ